ncbi:sensor domain-containing diguanylate cyclase [Parapusillimonas granuli]|uniref:diguanylate cyclase n=1 Tax=Parapusillimonas granuli TaxID=380911 RepID=A0A853FR55_9BURK|nr:diguanylate cyclase [Parapusillimonas granuli]MBB5213475.1 diguanylate cyclase (GGDEF)-like protein/PAS domain S-box-containing protein [Parapusillimonas granuli]MEB2398568.1 diguanylate cyclase [Alcaligenaceae bacterium]NYT48314.1 diguanylate cyclase [Parapusillimonas granuli]
MSVSNMTSRRARAQQLTLGVALLVLAAIVVAHLWTEYHRARKSEEERLATQSTIIAQNIELHLASTNQALESILAYAQSQDVMAQIAYLKSMVSAMPGVGTAGVLDHTGRQTASSRPEHIGSDFSRREYFKTVQRAPAAKTLYVSEPYVSAANVYSVNLSRAIIKPDGNFKGMAYATLNTEYFDTLLKSVLYAPDMWAAIVHSDGLPFLRRPRSAGGDHQHSLDNAVFMRHLRSGKHSSVMYDRPASHPQTQVVALRTAYAGELHMDDALIIATGRDTGVVLAPWKRLALLEAGLFILISIAAVICLLVYQVRQHLFDEKEAMAQKALRAKDEDYRLIVEGTTDLVVKMDIQGRYTYVNPAFCELYGAEPAALLGRHFLSMGGGNDADAAAIHLDDVLNPPYFIRYRQRSDTAKGLRDIEWLARPLWGDGDAPQGIVNIGRDISQHVETMNRLQLLAHRDGLTNLPNRNHFMATGDAEVLAARRHGHPLSVMMLDVDHFKSINDTYGHHAGDQVLKALSDILHAGNRIQDVAGRLGGEEFAVLLPHANLANALSIAERVRAAIAENGTVTAKGEVIRFTASIGVASLRDGIESFEQLLQMADEGLYEAKRAGRDSVRTVQDTVPDHARPMAPESSSCPS